MTDFNISSTVLDPKPVSSEIQIAGDVVTEGSFSPRLDQPCLVCKTTRETIEDLTVEESKEFVVNINDQYDHTLGPECMFRAQAQNHPAYSLEQIADSFRD